jgi:hypothetical protein
MIDEEMAKVAPEQSSYLSLFSFSLIRALWVLAR